MPPTIQGQTHDENGLDREQRLQLALATFRDPSNTLSIRELARRHGVPSATLGGRIHNRMSIKDKSEKWQRLTNAEQDAIERCALHLPKWGWPTRPEFLQALIADTLKAKGDTQPLGTNWTQKFLHRRLNLKAVYSPPAEEKKPHPKSAERVERWFQLFASIRAEHDIQPQNIYNLSERGFTVGVITELKAFHSKQKKVNSQLPVGGDWTSALECVSVDGRFLPSWFTFKAKKPTKAWQNALTDAAHLSSNESGWTNNQQFLEWIKDCFDPCTRMPPGNQYRLLCLDGQTSYVSVDIVEYCVANHIILLRVPSAPAYALEPMDVGVIPAMANAYHEGLQKHSATYNVVHNIEKMDFIRVYQEAKRTTMNAGLICLAWDTVGLAPFNPHRIIQQPPQIPQQQEVKDERWTFQMRPLLQADPNGTLFEGLLVYDGPSGHKERKMDHDTTMALKEVLANATKPGRNRRVPGWEHTGPSQR